MGSEGVTKCLREIAFHEAGHYVAKWALVGDAVYGDTLTIVPDPEAGALGTCAPLEEDIDTEEGCHIYIISLYAGAVAQSRVFLSPVPIPESERIDNEEAGKYLKMVSESEEELREQTRRIIDENWNVVERIAQELLKYLTLDPEECSFLADNDMEGLERYRQFYKVKS